MSLNLTYMLNFIQVVEWGNISKAAAFLNIAQPALSRQIRFLEDALGTTLLRRHSWGVEPTEDGKLLLEHARRIQKECVAVEEGLRSNRENPVGTAYLGIPSAYSVTLVPPLMERMRTRYPNISVRIVEAFSGTIYEWLVSGRLDLAMLYFSKEHDAAETFPFIIEDLVVVGSANLLAGKSEMALVDLAEYKLIAPWRPHMLRLTLESEFMAQGVSFAPFIEIDSMPCMKELAHKEAGITILPPSSVAREISDGRLTGVPLRPTLKLTTVLGQTPHRQPTQATKIVFDILQELASELAPKTGWRQVSA